MLRSWRELFTVNGLLFAGVMVVGFTIAGATLAPAIQKFIEKKE